MTSSIIDKITFGFGMAFFISDLLFPLWLIGIIIYLKRKGWQIWKAWFIASTFCLTQAYIVAKIVGYNIGAYTLIEYGSRISTLFYELPPKTPITEYLTPFQLGLEFWVAPPVTIIVIPTLVLFVLSKLIKRYKDAQKKNNSDRRKNLPAGYFKRYLTDLNE